MSKLEPTRTYSNPTATEVLRLLLDEQGLEWREHEAPATDCIAFFDGNGWHDCWESVDGEVNVTFSMTPEQAIAVTLGAGTCEADETDLIPFVRADSGDFEVDYIHVMECSSCGGTYEYVNGSYEFLPPNYCPNCGRRVEQ